MKIRPILVVTAIPGLIGTFGFIVLNQVNAANRLHQIAQVSDKRSNHKVFAIA